MDMLPLFPLSGKEPRYQVPLRRQDGSTYGAYPFVFPIGRVAEGAAQKMRNLFFHSPRFCATPKQERFHPLALQKDMPAEGAGAGFFTRTTSSQLRFLFFKSLVEPERSSPQKGKG